MILNDSNSDFKSTPLFDVEYLENDKRWGHSYCGIPTGTRMRSIKMVLIPMTFMTSNPDFKGTPLLDVECLRNSAR